MSFLDESGEIRATAFKAEVDKFFNLIEVNKVDILDWIIYRQSKCNLAIIRMFYMKPSMSAFRVLAFYFSI